MKPMRAVFRVDASIEMGTGHVMRCLTLADVLRERGADCRFVCRAHVGNLNDLIGDRGHTVFALPVASGDSAPGSIADDVPAHARWLGTDWATDARHTADALGDAPVDWIIVDHYALDARWENQLRPACRRLMVIDDLADRPHDCDLLLDQNLGRDACDYAPHVPDDCTQLIGPQYALLRPEFAALRAQSLERREEPQFRRLLITMGGVDKDNATGQVLGALKDCALPADCEVTVVMGPHAPWLGPVTNIVRGLPCPADLLVGVGNMAELMAHADLVIGAAGSTTWERCCLGVPSVMVVLADNQRELAASVGKLGAAAIIAEIQHITCELPALISSMIDRSESLRAMSHSAALLVDGAGADRIVQRLEY